MLPGDHTRPLLQTVGDIPAEFRQAASTIQSQGEDFLNRLSKVAVQAGFSQVQNFQALLLLHSTSKGITSARHSIVGAAVRCYTCQAQLSSFVCLISSTCHRCAGQQVFQRHCAGRAECGHRVERQPVVNERCDCRGDAGAGGRDRGLDGRDGGAAATRGAAACRPDGLTRRCGGDILSLGLAH